MTARVKVACFSPYPESAASVRQRIIALAPHWEANAVDIEMLPFMSERFYRMRKKFGTLATLRKIAELAWATLCLLPRIARAGRFDAVVIHREVFPLGGGLFDRWVAQRNSNTIFDVDDAIWVTPSHAVDQRSRFWDPRRWPRLLPLCRTVVVGNAYLGKYASAFNEHVEIIPTTYDDLGGGALAREREYPVIVWIGNWGNAEYLAPLGPMFERLAANVRFRLRLIGGGDITDFRPAGVEVEHVPWKPENEACGLLESDIGIMPLYDREHEKGKCAFKIIQYFSAGLAVVASPVGMNAEIIRSGENGMLASNPDQWFTTLRRLLKDATLRRAVGAAGYRTYREDFTRERAATAWQHLLTREINRP
jgi:glycosyltransferase involved in cell wall biosynthesis